MKVNGKHYRTIWISPDDDQIIQVIDQRSLPHAFVIEDLRTVDQVAAAIANMHVRGAGLIGAAAGYGMYLASLEAMNSVSYNDFLEEAGRKLIATRPTAVNLEWAVRRQMAAIQKEEYKQAKISIAKQTALNIADQDAAHCKIIGDFGLNLIKEILSGKKEKRINILTHCNAGWLAFVDFGSATSPIYAAFDAGIEVHVWVDETRPRNQGARLTAWELLQHGVEHTVIPDNAAGHLMQQGMVDLVITGTDRTTCTGDVANKIGTYQKALAAKDNNVPFYVALPSSSFDWNIKDGCLDIPIEKRDEQEVKYIDGFHEGQMKKVLLTPQDSPAVNYAFDVTPARLVSGLITERGICLANEKSIRQLFPEH